jgi:hypothetical protein
MPKRGDFLRSAIRRAARRGRAAAEIIASRPSNFRAPASARNARKRENQATTIEAKDAEHDLGARKTDE